MPTPQSSISSASYVPLGVVRKQLGRQRSWLQWQTATAICSRFEDRGDTIIVDKDSALVQELKPSEQEVARRILQSIFTDDDGRCMMFDGIRAFWYVPYEKTRLF